jgi:hypothetical protein
MKKLLSLCVIISVLLMAVSSSMAGEIDLLINLLIKKGILTQKEAEELKQEISKEQAMSLKTETQSVEANEDKSAESPISISGSLYGEYRWIKNRDIADPDTDSTSDLYLRKLELAVEAQLVDWITASAVFNSEWIGDDVNQGDERVTVDEATLTMQDDALPLYLVVGKRTQPFGVFENHLVTDPMTQDAYETKRVGITAGYTGPMGLDLSVTVYKGEEQMGHLFESGLFEDSLRRSGEATDDVGSYIVSATVQPFEYLTLFGGYLSEPGRGSRNETINGGLSLVPPFMEGLRLDAEYIKALNRERYDGVSNEYKEGVFSATLAYEFVVKKRERIGGGLFAARRAHLVSEPLEVALRYEHFDDDGMSDDLGMWTVKDRYSAGARYSFYNDEETGFNAFVAGEYRHTELRVHEAMKDSNDEVYLRLGVDF